MREDFINELKKEIEERNDLIVGLRSENDHLKSELEEARMGIANAIKKLKQILNKQN